MDIDSLLPKVDADLEAAEGQLRAAQGHVDELRQLKDSLLYAVRMYGGEGAAAERRPSRESHAVHSDVSAPEAGSIEWLLLKKMDAAERALREIGRPAETREIQRFMETVGRSDEYEHVKSSLNYLKRQGRVISVRPGLWELGRKDSGGTASTVPPATVPASGAGGDTGAQPRADRDLDQNYRFRNGDHDYGASVAEAVS